MRTALLAFMVLGAIGINGCIVREEHPHPRTVVVEERVWVPGHYRPDGVFVEGYYR